jgi:serine/threonine-protein kinase
MRQPERLGKYRILKSLGAGGMGEVYLAEHEMLRVLHAVKILASQARGKAEFEARFQAEARTMARLRHPGIVPVHYMDRDEATGAYYIVMDFVSPDGKNQQTLEDLLKRSGGRLSHKRTAEILRTLCDAVAYAHEEGVLHRDVKPSNVLIDAGGIVRLTGFYPAETVGQEYLGESIGSNRLEGSLGLKKTTAVEKEDADALGSDARFLPGRMESLAGPFHCIPPEVQ